MKARYHSIIINTCIVGLTISSEINAHQIELRTACESTAKAVSNSTEICPATLLQEICILSPKFIARLFVYWVEYQNNCRRNRRQGKG
jgi:hypothetical protein